jgi:hypothetical protein
MTSTLTGHFTVTVDQGSGPPLRFYAIGCKWQPGVLGFLRAGALSPGMISTPQWHQEAAPVEVGADGIIRCGRLLVDTRGELPREFQADRDWVEAYVKQEGKTLAELALRLMDLCDLYPEG